MGSTPANRLKHIIRLQFCSINHKVLWPARIRGLRQILLHQRRNNLNVQANIFQDFLASRRGACQNDPGSSQDLPHRLQHSALKKIDSFFWKYGTKKKISRHFGLIRIRKAARPSKKLLTQEQFRNTYIAFLYYQWIQVKGNLTFVKLWDQTKINNRSTVIRRVYPNIGFT